ncbi:hypothetical protein ACA910_000308 [Epithemia clementina (nom. ined.)]
MSTHDSEARDHTMVPKGPVQISMEETLQNDPLLAPLHHLELWNESYKHKGPKDAESHFKAIVVSPQFEDKSMLQRHRMVNASLSNFIMAPVGETEPPKVHALSIVAKTPAQWKVMQERGETVTPSPNCRGGDGRVSS